MATTTASTITVELPNDLKRDLAALAERTGRSESEIIIEAVERHMANGRIPRPTSFGMGDDPELSGADSEDWLQANWRPEDDWGRE